MFRSVGWIARTQVGSATLAALAAGCVHVESTPAPPSPDLSGFIDMHVHSAPDVIARSVDDHTAAQEASAAGMRALVLKNHRAPTAARAALASRHVPDTEIFGGVVLNQSVGGLNPAAIRAMADTQGKRGKVVWLPTIDAATLLPKTDNELKTLLQPPNGVLHEILMLIAERDLVLATGHLPSRFVPALLTAAKQRGVKRMLITHALTYPVHAAMPVLQQAATLGAYIELVRLVHLDRELPKHAQGLTAADSVAVIRAVGPQHIVISSDLGRAGYPRPVQGLHEFVLELRAHGITQAELRTMLHDNPADLLGLSR